MFKKNLKLIIILSFSLLFVVFFIFNSIKKYNNISIGTNLKDVREIFGTPNFRSVSNGKIHEQYRLLIIYKCVFIYNENDSLLIQKWKQID